MDPPASLWRATTTGPSRLWRRPRRAWGTKRASDQVAAFRTMMRGRIDDSAAAASRSTTTGQRRPAPPRGAQPTAAASKMVSRRAVETRGSSWTSWWVGGLKRKSTTWPISRTSSASASGTGGEPCRDGHLVMTGNPGTERRRCSLARRDLLDTDPGEKRRQGRGQGGTHWQIHRHTAPQ